MKDDFFRLKEIKKLRKVAGGDTFVIIYLKMILLSLKNDGGLIFEGIEQDFAEQISLEIDEDLENVKLTIAFLINNRLLLETESDEFLLPYAVECTGKETQSAQRVRAFRERQKSLQCNATVTECNDKETECNTEKEKREKRKDIEKEIDTDNSFGDKPPKQERQKIEYSAIMEYFNSNCTGFPSIREMTDKRKNAIRSFLRNHTESDLYQLFDMAQASDFLTGAGSKGWRADFDWILKPANAVKILEGNYRNRKNENEPDFSNMPKGYKGLYEFMKGEFDESDGIF